MKFAHIVLFLSIFCYCAIAQEPTPLIKAEDSVIKDVFIARDDGNGKAGEVVESFKTSDVPIYCVVMLTGLDPITVKMNLVAVKVTGVKPETKVVTAGYTTKQGENRVNFTGRPDKTWVAGTYRIDVIVDGKTQKSLTFEMSISGPPTGASNFAPPKAKPRPAKRN